MRVKLGGWERGLVSAASGEGDRGRRLLLLLVVYLAQDGGVLQAELVALAEARVAHGTREALHVEHQVTCPHHHLGEQNGGLTSGTALHAEQPATEHITLLLTQTLCTARLNRSVFRDVTQCSYVSEQHIAFQAIGLKTNSMVCVCERTIPTERTPLVGEVIANFCG
jgi:hypothetical protein